MSWSNSTRRQRLPKDWPALVGEVKRRAQGRCEATRHAPDCPGTGREVDHRVQGDNHGVANLQYLSTQCHAAKTRAENSARNRLHATLRKRPGEQHPGARQ